MISDSPAGTHEYLRDISRRVCAALRVAAARVIVCADATSSRAALSAGEREGRLRGEKVVLGSERAKGPPKAGSSPIAAYARVH
jgi:hypothetical protein